MRGKTFHLCPWRAGEKVCLYIDATKLRTREKTIFHGAAGEDGNANRQKTQTQHHGGQPIAQGQLQRAAEADFLKACKTML